jgi:hypothetical protein
MKKKLVLFAVLAVAVIMVLCLAGCAETAVAIPMGDKSYEIDVGSNHTQTDQDYHTMYDIILPQIMRLSPIEKVSSLREIDGSTRFIVVLEKPVDFSIISSGGSVVVVENNKSDNCQNSVTTPPSLNNPIPVTVTTTIVVTSTVIVK